jgi:galactokinase/mevalonate kinase-like predicted kinase
VVKVIVASAPGRCGIIGNPSDMYGGSVISISTCERATCRLELSDRLMLSAEDESQAPRTQEDLALRGDKLDIARATLTYFQIDPATARFTVSQSTEIAMQSGMAGSTALIVSLVGALDRFFGWKMHPWAIAETARKIEYRVMKVLCGLQDQHMAVFGGLNFMDFARKERLEQRDDEPLATVEPLHRYCPDVPLLAAHTGIKHHSGTVHKSPRERWLAGEKLVVETFETLGALARLGKRALLDRDWATLGALMNENHRLVANLGGSGPANDHLIETARKAGAWGAKLAGAGGGGTILVLTDKPDDIGRRLLDAGADRLFFPQPRAGLTVLEE